MTETTDAGAVVLQAARPRVWTVFVAYVAVLAAMIVLQVIVVAVVVAWKVSKGVDSRQAMKDLMDTQTAPAGFILLGMGSQLMIGLGAILPARMSPEPTRVRLGWMSPGLPLWEYAVFALSSLLFLVIGVALAAQLAKVLPPDNTYRLLNEKMTPALVAPLVLFVALGPGFMEELLFRGYVQRRLLQRWSPAVAITVASLLFALMHMTPHAILGAVFLGFWFGVIAWRTGSMWPTIVCHAFVNGSWNLWNLGTKFAGLPPASHPAVVTAALCVGVICFVAALRILKRPIRSSAPVPLSVFPAPYVG